MNRISLAIAAALILLVACLMVFSSGSSPSATSNSSDVPPPQQRSSRSLSASSNEWGHPPTIAEKSSRPPVAASDMEAYTPPDRDLPSPSEIRQASEFRQALRREGEEYNEATGNVTILHPAVWIDPTDDGSLPSEHHDGIRQIAEEFNKKMEESDLDPASPEYRRLWNDAVRETNWKFRARYGARAWSRQHIKAYHLAHSGPDAEKH